jgi:putative oxidoreductase
MQALWDLIYAIGRIALVAVFIKFGVDNLMAPTGLNSLLSQKGFPQPMLFTYLAALVQIVCGVLVAIGWHTRLAAFGLAAFVVIATLLAHQYWTMTGPPRSANTAQFWKNVALLGGLFMVMANGAGRFSIDRR